jgi:hypothetical protein
MKTLVIVIKSEYFDMIARGEKTTEYREVTPFWTSRLYDKEGKKRQYDRIEFINGYNADARRMITEYNGFTKRGSKYNIQVGKITESSSE